MCVLKELSIITFSLWCTTLLGLSCRYGQKVTLVKKWVNYMPRKGVTFENSHFQNCFSSPSSCSGCTH